MTATVTKECLINGEPQSVGSTVEVDNQTFANLSRKGWLAEVGDGTTPGDSLDAVGESLPAEGDALAVTTSSTKSKRKNK